MLELDWWVWVLIGLGVVIIGYLKLKVWGAMSKKKTPTKHQENDD
jgi:hypothetical protein